MSVLKRYIFTFFCLLWLQGFIFAQTPVSTPPVSTEIEGSKTVHFGDLIDVDVLGSVEYDWRGTISPEGFLSGIDFVEEPIYALCRTEEDIARQVEKAYGKLLREPKVVVRVLDRTGRPVSVLYGAVKTPQRFQIQRSVRLNELIILSGGITERASGEIQIFRPQYLSCQAEKKTDENKVASEEEKRTSFVSTRQTDGSTYINIKIADLLSGKTDANPLILTGDIVTIMEAEPIYIIGGVASPKQISSRSAQMTVSRAISTAGGLTKDADPTKIVIFRRAARESKIIEVDLDAVKAEKAEDIVLQAFDIVDVPQKGRAKRKFPPVIRSVEGGERNALNLPLRIVD